MVSWDWTELADSVPILLSVSASTSMDLQADSKCNLQADQSEARKSVTTNHKSVINSWTYWWTPLD